MVMKNNITIIMSYWNVENEYWEKSIQSILKFNIPVIIFNDNCDEEYREQLFKYKDKIKIIDSKKNYGQPTATWNTLQEVKTKYVIRVDSDDELLSLPSTNQEFEALHIKGKVATNIWDWLKNGGSLNGSIYTTELFKFMYKDHEFMGKFNRWIHEDNYALLRLFYYKKDAKIIHSNNRKCYRRNFREGSEVSFKVARRISMRFETFKLMLMQDENNDVKDFIKYDIIIRGYDNYVINKGIITEEFIQECTDEYNKRDFNFSLII